MIGMYVCVYASVDRLVIERGVREINHNTALAS